MKSLKDELGDDYNSHLESTLVNSPGWCGGNPFFFYTDNPGAGLLSKQKDKFVEICINGKTGGVVFTVQVENTDEEKSFFVRVFEGHQVSIPYIEKVTGRILNVCYLNEDFSYDFFWDSYEVKGRQITAYSVDEKAMEVTEKLDLLYKPATVPATDDSKHEDAHEYWNQFHENMDVLEKKGYYGDFMILH
jgi:hypothetical protein